MNNLVRRILPLVLALCLCLPMFSAMAETASENVEIVILTTSDIHGQFYASDYTAAAENSGTYRQGLTRVASYVKEVRAAHENVLLTDIGDTIQGTPLTYYYAFSKPEVEDPAVKAMRTMDYDMWVLGNHEFNYGMDILNRQLNYATAPATETEDAITISVANYLDNKTNSDEAKDWATWNSYKPYVIYEFDGVKVAVMGMGNAHIPNWDVPANWEGIYFANATDTYLHYEAEMEEAADMIVLMSHTGVEGGDGSGDLRSLIAQTDSIDLVFAGHEHSNHAITIANAAGKEIPVVCPSTKCNVIGQATINYNKTTGEATIAAENVSMRNYAIDPELESVLKPYEEATWNDYLLLPIGKASGDFSAANLGTAPSAFMDLINRVQIWGAYDNTGLNTADDPSDDVPAQLSISAPLTSGNAANLIPAGDIKLGDMFSLYRYENWFYQIRMTGKEVRTWLEYAASKVTENEDGTLSIAGGLTYYDVIYGEGFSYVIDYAKPADSRVVSMTMNGVEIKDDEILTVVVNNYRYNGGGNYVAYLNEHGCEFIANDESRIVYSTQYDMIQGEDMGQARNLLANYITMNGTIEPTITSTWSVVKGE